MKTAFTHPEAFGLREIDTLITSHPEEYDGLAVWLRESDGAILWATTGGVHWGASPFDNVTGVDSLTVAAGPEDFEARAREWYTQSSGDDTPGLRDRLEFLIIRIHEGEATP